jgi:glucose-6-phosphate isomerase
VGDDGRVGWQPNPRYDGRPLVHRGARAYPELGLVAGVPVYELFARDPEAVQWVSEPARAAGLWDGFDP